MGRKGKEENQKMSLLLFELEKEDYIAEADE